MADTNMNQNSPNKQHENKQNESMERQQGQSMTGERKPEQGGDKNRQDEQSREKSAIGGGQSGQNPTSQTGEPGRARSELDQNKSEPTSR